MSVAARIYDDDDDDRKRSLIRISQSYSAFIHSALFNKKSC